MSTLFSKCFMTELKKKKKKIQADKNCAPIKKHLLISLPERVLNIVMIQNKAVVFYKDKYV